MKLRLYGATEIGILLLLLLLLDVATQPAVTDQYNKLEINPLNGRGVNWLHFVIQSNLHFKFLTFWHFGAQP